MMYFQQIHLLLAGRLVQHVLNRAVISDALSDCWSKQRLFHTLHMKTVSPHRVHEWLGDEQSNGSDGEMISSKFHMYKA